MARAPRLELLRQNMLLILRAYGVSLDDISATSLHTEELKTKQPPRYAILGREVSACRADVCVQCHEATSNRAVTHVADPR